MAMCTGCGQTGTFEELKEKCNCKQMDRVFNGMMAIIGTGAFMLLAWSLLG